MKQVGAQIIDGKAIAAKVREEVRLDAEAFEREFGRKPGLHVVLVGDDPASAVYVRNKEVAAEKANIAGAVHRLPQATSEAEVLELVARVVAGADENSGQEMGNAILQCKRISQKAKAMVLLVHHSGKDTSKGPRGWSGITAACDSEIVVERNNDMRSITARKVKEGVDGISYLFSLHTVVLGVDEDGDDITSCIVEFKGDGKVKAEPKKKTGANELALLDALHNVIGMGDMKAGVDTARVQDKFCEDFDPSKRQSYKNQSFKRAKDTLLDKGTIYEENGMLFLDAENADS